MSLKYFPEKSLKRLGLDARSLSEQLTALSRQGADIVKVEFENLLDELKSESVSDKSDGPGKTFDGYTVEVEEVPSSVSTAAGTFNFSLHSIRVKAPPGVKNVFDILDEGRPGLPKRSPDHPYPIWSARDAPLTAERSVRGKGGRFSVLRSGTSGRGIRFKDDLPALFTPGPIAPVPARNLYERVWKQSLKKSKGKRLSIRLVLVDSK